MIHNKWLDDSERRKSELVSLKMKESPFHGYCRRNKSHQMAEMKDAWKE